MDTFYDTMPEQLKRCIEEALRIEFCPKEVARHAVGVTDHTSLSDADTPMMGSESEEAINALCAGAKGKDNLHTAAVCVYPNQVARVRAALGDADIAIAVVNNFPHGSACAEEAEAQALAAVQAGVDEIDTVIDYVALQNGDIETVREKLQAVSAICKAHGVKLKTIVKASVYTTYDQLYEAAFLAIECGADFVKTCTGKMPLPGYGTGQPDASTLFTAATVMRAVYESGRKDVGVKISGGVKTPKDCAQMKYLADAILGQGVFENKNRFRFGASSLTRNLLEYIEDTSPYMQDPPDIPYSY